VVIWGYNATFIVVIDTVFGELYAKVETMLVGSIAILFPLDGETSEFAKAQIGRKSDFRKDQRLDALSIVCTQFHGLSRMKSFEQG